jgi:hypothetical protein
MTILTQAARFGKPDDFFRKAAMKKEADGSVFRVRPASLTFRSNQ